MNRSGVIGFIPVILTIALFGAYVAYANSQALPVVATYTTTATTSSPFVVGSVQFSGAWSFVGNVTLSGAQSTCEVLGLPCASNPSNSAMEFSDRTSTAYVEFASLNDVELTVVLINGQPYCASPTLFTQPACPSEIGAENIPSSVVTTNSTLGLELVLSLNSTSVQAGQGIAINVTEYNNMQSVNNVSSKNNWAIGGLTLGGCGTLNYPMGIEIFNGNYDQNNLSSLTTQTAILFYQPGIYNCPAIFFVKNYQFEPASNYASIGIGSGLSNSTGSVSSLAPYPMTTDIPVSGGWTGGNSQGTGAIYHNFTEGTYTVIAGDEWGDVAFLHFTVS